MRRLACAPCLVLWCLWLAGGCYAPLSSPGVPARVLPDTFRYPERTLAEPLNFANLTVPEPPDYLLGPGDILAVTVPDLFAGAQVEPLTVQVMASGDISLPLVGKVNVADMNLLQAQEAINQAYADGILVDPKVNVMLSEKESIQVLVLGSVLSPGLVELPRFQNDVGHALASAGGLTDEAADHIEVHRRATKLQKTKLQKDAASKRDRGETTTDAKSVLTIPLRGLEPGQISQDDVILEPGDVVVVPSARFDVFWVVGELDSFNRVVFGVTDRERELGRGFLLPSDRDIDVVTAVTMAGYIDPINSPTRVTVHRTSPLGEPILIHVDLIKARYDRRETVMVLPGDIIYLNPDMWWWLRRKYDQWVDTLVLTPYIQGVTEIIRD